MEISDLNENFVIKEKALKDYPEPISLESTEIIIEQMKKFICKIILEDGTKASGFFCKIPFPSIDHLITVLITNNHVINEKLLYKGEKIELIINEESKTKNINLNNRIKYTNEEYDITIIEIKQEYDKIYNFLELDNNIITETSNIKYIKESIYIIQYPEGKLSVSYGLLNNIQEEKKYNFCHLCSTKEGSSGSPILNLSNNKVIGIHKESSKKNFNYNVGLFLNFPLNQFIEQNCYNKKYNDFISRLNGTFNLQLKPDKIDKIDLSKNDKENINFETINKAEIKELVFDGNKNISDLKLDNSKFEKLEKLYIALYGSTMNYEILKIFNFQKLKELYIILTDILDLSFLEKTNFPKLEKLYLSANTTLDINILSEININKLKVLSLECKEISDITILEKVKFKKLEKFILNCFSFPTKFDINILQKVNFNLLNELILNCFISDINIFEKVKFEKLEKLNLSNNKILDINIFEKVNFKELKELNLSSNKISNIKVFKKVKFEQLEKLILSNNKISDILLENKQFKKLKVLDLSYNELSDINKLEYADFEELRILNLNNNNISNIHVFGKIKFEKLEKLYLSRNKLTNIKILAKINLKYLKELNLKSNKIADISIFKSIKIENLESLILENNDISDLKELENIKHNLLQKNFKKNHEKKISNIEINFKNIDNRKNTNININNRNDEHPAPIFMSDKKNILKKEYQL